MVDWSVVLSLSDARKGVFIRVKASYSGEEVFIQLPVQVFFFDMYDHINVKSRNGIFLVHDSFA